MNRVELVEHSRRQRRRIRDHHRVGIVWLFDHIDTEHVEPSVVVTLGRARRTTEQVEQ